MFVHVECPLGKFNDLIRTGKVEQVLKKILDDIKPEACYFTENNGCRGCFMVVDVTDDSSIPAISEPFFVHFDAKVEFHICMTTEDLSKANLEVIGEKVGLAV